MAEIWTPAPGELAHVKPYRGEYLAIVAFVREYGADCDVLDAKGAAGPTPQALAYQLNQELQEACNAHGLPAGRWQVLAIDAPRRA